MVSGSANRKGIVYRLLVSKKTGRIAIDEMVIDEPLISQYASFARCASPLLSLLNHAFVPGFKNGPEDFSSRAFGQSYHCLFPFFGKRILGCLPVQPRREKLPAWAQKDATQLENGLRVYMFPDAFPARFWAENAIKAQVAGDGDLLAAVSLYPQFAKSLGVNPNEKVQPLKLEGWAKHGLLFAQDTRERLAAELLAQMGDKVGLKTSIFRFGSTDVFLIGKGHAEDTFFATFDAGSIHSEIKYGRHVAGKQISSGKKSPGLAQLISEGDTFALSVARKHLPLRTLLQEAAEMKDPFAIRACAIMAEF